MCAETPKQLVEEVFPTKFKPEKAAGIDIIAQLSVTGQNGGNWIVTIKNQTLKIAQGTHPSPTIAIKIADSDFMDLSNGKISTSKAFFTGKLQLVGDLNLALKLRDAGILNGN